MVSMKINFCPDVVSERDIMVMEMHEWCELIRQREMIDDALHNCLFTASHMDAWKRRLSFDDLHDLYIKPNR